MQKLRAFPAASIDGAGSTFVATIVQQWVKDYQAACPGSVINYKGGGSGAGVQQFTEGTVQFAGSDVPLTAGELAAAEGKVRCRQSRHCCRGPRVALLSSTT